jgi:flagellar basal-body rod modification protein FlgD
MSTVNALGANYAADTTNNSSNSNKSTSSTEFGKDEFLKLLVAQLKNQDPMNPMNNEQFVTQLATFSSLEQLMSINEAVSQLAGLDDSTKSSTT